VEWLAGRGGRCYLAHGLVVLLALEEGCVEVAALRRNDLFLCLLHERGIRAQPSRRFAAQRR
jgi:hypothetical protein